MSKVLYSANGKKLIVVPQEKREECTTPSEQEMDRRARKAVAAAIEKAFFCGKPVARYDLDRKEAFLEYPDGKIVYIK